VGLVLKFLQDSARNWRKTRRLGLPIPPPLRIANCSWWKNCKSFKINGLRFIVLHAERGVRAASADNNDFNEFFVDASCNAGTLCPMWLVLGTPDMSVLASVGNARRVANESFSC